MVSQFTSLQYILHDQKSIKCVRTLQTLFKTVNRGAMHASHYKPLKTVHFKQVNA